LLKRVSKDYDVQIAYGKTLANASTKEGRAQGLTYARKLVDQYPKKRGTYALLGRAYDALWVSKDDPSARFKAIEAYKRYLELTPDKPRYAESRRNVQALIKVAERGR